MKKFLNLPALLLLVLASFMIISCEDEPGGGGGNEVGPTATLNSDGTLTVAPGEDFIIDFSVIKGDAAINAYTIYEDGVKVPTGRILVDGAAVGDAAVLVVGTDKEGFSNKMVTISAHSTAATLAVYEIRVVDENQLTDAIFVDVNTVGTPPIVSATPPTEFFSEQGIKNTLKITATTGSGKLSQIEVLENGTTMDPSRVSWLVSSPAVETNPFDLAEAEQDGFVEAELFIVTPMMEGNFAYKIEVTDEFGLMHSVTYTITVLPAGTAVSVREDVLLNQAGPDGTGGLDLDTGASVGSNDDTAEIVDNGVDFDLPDDVNWIQTISPANGTTMKYVVPGANGILEGFSYDGLQFKEDIVGLYTDNTGTVIDENASSSVVLEGDMFVVFNGTNYWLVKVKTVNIKVDDNSDNYVFDVKF